MNDYLKPYVPLVDFLADYLGENTEVLLHDLTDLEHSIVKIRNGHISGRQEGDPCTDLALRVAQNQPDNIQYSTNYKSYHQNGTPMKSGTFFIRNSRSKIIGMLCINIECEQYMRMKTYLDSFFGLISRDEQTASDNGNGETLGKSITDTIDAIIEKAVNEWGGQVDLLSPKQKEMVIQKLNDEGVFQLKGSVSKAATALKVSEPSVYRYLKNLRKLASSAATFKNE